MRWWLLGVQEESKHFQMNAFGKDSKFGHLSNYEYILGGTSYLTLFWWLFTEKENSEFIPVKVWLRIELVS